MVDLSSLSREALERMRAAGEEVVDCHRVLAKTNDNLVGELLRDVETFYEWDHYPKGDVYDRESHSQYYYHAHPQDQRPGEHGHFHTFLRPKGIRPAKVADYEAPKDKNDALSHLIGISMDEHGIPIRVFSTNRWVTGEIWYKAADVVRLLDCFEIDLARPSWPLNRWLTAMMCLFRPQIVEALHERDAAVRRWRKARPGKSPFEDRKLEVTSSIDVSIDDQVRAVEEALSGR